MATIGLLKRRIASQKKVFARTARNLGTIVMLATIWGQVDTARACAIDGVPSVKANNRFTAPNGAPPTNATDPQWAPFMFDTIFTVSRQIVFSEDRRRLARSLPPSIVRGRWIWRFGDGASVRGATVTHIYTKPGTYVLTVAMPLPRNVGLFVFDAAVVRVRSR